MLTRTEVDAYKRPLDKICEGAKAQFIRTFTALQNQTPEKIRDTLLEVTPAICLAYGKAAAAIAAEFYETQHDKHRDTPFTAQVADVAPVEQIQASVRYAAGFLFEGCLDTTKDILAGAVSSYVREAANRTIAENAVRESAGR